MALYFGDCKVSMNLGANVSSGGGGNDSPIDLEVLVAVCDAINGEAVAGEPMEEKVMRLMYTKEDIKAALIEKGQEVSDADTFRSYADKIRNIEGGGTIEGVHYVTFMNEDGTGEPLYVKPVFHGDNCMNPVSMGWIPKPTKEPTERLVYTFSGWEDRDLGVVGSTALANVTKDRTVYAKFTESERLYTVNFYDGESLLKTMTVPYGGTANFVPSKAGYAFSEWQPSNENITEEPTNCYAVWTTVIDSGVVGEHSTGTTMWSLDANYVLTISSTGESPMGSYSSYNKTPWFEYYKDIKSVIIGPGVTNIGRNAFYNCSNLTDITISDSVTKIETHAFTGSGLQSITIPASVTTIEEHALNGSYLSSIRVDENNMNYSSDDAGALFNKDKTVFIKLPQGRKDNYVIPDSVTSIQPYSMQSCANMNMLTIPEGITEIPAGLCYMCSGLIHVSIPDSVTTIRHTAFNSCSNLPTITIGPGVTLIEAGAFAGCSSLESALFRNVSNWGYKNSSTDTTIAGSIPAYQLNDEDTAATYLKSTYANKIWIRSA